MESNNKTGVDLHPLVSTEQLTIGTVIVYHLLPEENPTDPQQAWRGKIISTTLLALGVVGVESLEEGHEGYMEDVLLEQIVGIEPGAAQ